MSQNVKKWYDFVLQQMAAESYLDQIGKNGNDLTKVLMLGSNNAGYPQSNGEYPLPDTKILDGATRMTATQATDFTTRYSIIDHRANDDARFAAMGINANGVNIQIGNGSGLSATLLLDNTTGQYTLSVRSTEYTDTNE